MTDKQAGKFGKKRHFELIKKSLLYALEKYYERFAVIMVENHEIVMGASLGGAWSYDGQYKLHPDIVIIFKEREEGYAKPKTIVVEAETSLNGLLKDEMRLTAYKLLRLNEPDKSKFMMYIALPTQLKGKAKKPEQFNGFWYFDVGEDTLENHALPVSESEGRGESSDERGQARAESEGGESAEL